MKTKQPLIVISMTLAFILACNTLVGQPSGNEEETASTPTPEAATQTTDLSTPLAGLAYTITTNDYPTSDVEIWQFGEDGKQTKIFEGQKILYGPSFSPDGRRAIYTGYGPDFCTWLADYATNSISLFVCGYDEFGIHAHNILGWLPEQPDTLLGIKVTDPGSGSYLGTLETISLLDGSVQPLDSVMTLGGALSLDGRMIAYASSGYPPLGYLHSFDSGATAFAPQEYGVDYPYAGSPGWSPDGKKIVWGLANESGISAIGVFDLQNKTGLALHPFDDGTYDMSMSEPNVPSAVWSPDGQWLALDACVHDPDQLALCDSESSGLWIMNTDGQAEYQLDGTFAGWSPNSQWVLSLATNYEINETELRVSRLDGSEMVSLGKVTDAYHRFNASWNSNGEYLAFKGADNFVYVTEAENWQPLQLGQAGQTNDPLWHPNGGHLIYADENYAIWVAETGIWQPQQMAEIDVPENSDGNASVSLFWHSVILPAFDLLTLTPGISPTP